jgi:hypothetical protein
MLAVRCTVSLSSISGCATVWSRRCSGFTWSPTALQAGQHHGKLVAANAGQVLAVAHRLGQPLAQFGQHAVAFFAAQLGIEGGKAVQVDVGHGQLLLQGHRAVHAHAQQLDEAGAVGQPGQLIVVGDEVHLRLVGLDRRNVLRRAPGRVGLPVGGEGKLGALAHPSRRQPEGVMRCSTS